MIIEVSPLFYVKGLSPTSIVLGKDEAYGPLPSESYYTRMRLCPVDGKTYEIMGHYNLTLEEAVKDFCERANRIRVEQETQDEERKGS